MDDFAHLNSDETISGAPEGYDAFLLLQCFERTKRPVLHIARDDQRLEMMRNAIRFFSPTTKLRTFPAWDCPLYSKISPNLNLMAKRLGTLAAITRARQPFVVLTTANAVVQFLPPRSAVIDSCFTASVRSQVDDSRIREFLDRNGFMRRPKVVEPGEYAIRGGIIDIFPPGIANPVRLDFFGDVLEGIRRFDAETQRTIGNLRKIDLSLSSEVILNPDSIARFRRKYRTEFGTSHEDDPLYLSVSEHRRFAGMEHWLPFFYENLETLFDYVPDATVFLDQDVEDVFERRWTNLVDMYEARTEMASMEMPGSTDSNLCKPDSLIMGPGRLERVLSDFSVRRLKVNRQLNAQGETDAGGRLGIDFAFQRKSDHASLISTFAEFVRETSRSGHVVIACWSNGSRDRLKLILEDEGVVGARTISNFSDIREHEGGLSLATWKLAHGFATNSITVISEQDVFGDRKVRVAKRRRRRKSSATLLAEAGGLLPGDLVVHIEHGIGRFIGLETIAVENTPHDCAAIEYARGDRLYVPVENIDVLSRFGTGDAPLDRLGSAAWQERKARMRKHILEMADELLKVAAARALQSAPVLKCGPAEWESFLARFQFDETPDQLAAAEEILADLTSGTPMDRLVCGDVGFGKTEIAMRAAFLAATSNKQVALLAPTSLLANQHYKNFRERFRGFPLVVEQLSKIVTQSSADAVRRGLADGTVDIVIGTHALLSKHVTFKDLGLTIIDEEQSFGVAQKEKLKKLKASTHVLALTATPIPRTLQMAMSGVRDLSIIGTPPPDRLAIRTFVTEFSPATVREALLREYYRGGQTFIVAPRIRDLPEIVEFLREQVPEIRFAVAHGRLASRTLEDRMKAFYEGKCNVLVSTTIVASGLDIPTANTIIIYHADRFGLAQLYQIRGRVGRSGTRAYAYVTYSGKKKLTDRANNRIKILGSLDSLGAGFSLASHDLDMRGAGNLLGDAQSGHIREVGVELYQQMLEAAIAVQRTGETVTAGQSEENWVPQLNLGLAVMIPEKFVSDKEIRLGLYRRLALVQDDSELEDMAAELIDRFGRLPREATILLELMRVKILCRRSGIARLDAGKMGVTIEFRNNSFANPVALVELASDSRWAAKIRSEKLVFHRNWKTEAERLKGVRLIVRKLCRLAEEVNQT